MNHCKLCYIGIIIYSYNIVYDISCMVNYYRYYSDSALSDSQPRSKADNTPLLRHCGAHRSCGAHHLLPASRTRGAAAVHYVQILSAPKKITKKDHKIS